MPRAALLVTAVAVIGVSSHADAAPSVAGGLDYTVARGSRVDHLDMGTRLEAGGFLRIYKNWQATVSLSGLMNVKSDLPERDGTELTGLGVGARLAYRYRFDRRGILYGALGFERIWLDGNDDVRRGCRETGACLVGYYTEKPDYDAWAPQARIGFGLEGNPNAMVIGLAAELVVEPMIFRDIPPDGGGGVVVFAALTATIGGGTKH